VKNLGFTLYFIFTYNNSNFRHDKILCLTYIIFTKKLGLLHPAQFVKLDFVNQRLHDM